MTRSNDLFAHIFAMVTFLNGKGHVVNHIITSQKEATILNNNAKVQGRAGTVTVSNGSLQVFQGMASTANVNAMLTNNRLPPFELYDLNYIDIDGARARFVPDNLMFFTCTTGRDEAYETTSGPVSVPNTLGYTGLGIPTG